jgi:hypothetical protein
LAEARIGFQTRQFIILWRSSRDGFSAQHFHRLCDGHPNTPVLIEDKPAVIKRHPDVQSISGPVDPVGMT